MSGTATRPGADRAEPADDPLDYCRAVEGHLCRRNDGHLIRVVGPAFDVVSAWQRDGVPFKIACAGIDRYVERYYRKGPRRRPVRIEFCDADVRDVFDEWRRATGIVGGAAPQDAHVNEAGRGTSLPDHLERALLRLTNARATGRLPAAADALIDTVSAALDEARAAHGGLRGERRQALLARLAALDGQLAVLARESLPPDAWASIEQAALDDLVPFRADLPEERFERARLLAIDRLVRVRLGLPVLTFA